MLGDFGPEWVQNCPELAGGGPTQEHFWGTFGTNHFLSKQKARTHHETSTCLKTDLFFERKTSGHETPHMASTINVLQQKSPPRAKRFGAGVIDP